MTGVYTVNAEPFDQLHIDLNRAAALLLTLDRAELLDRITCPPDQQPELYAAASVVGVVHEEIGRALDSYRACYGFEDESGHREAWRRAEARLASAIRTIDSLPAGTSDDVTDALARELHAAQLALVRLPARNMTEALRRLEVALKDGQLEGADPEELIAEAKGLL